MIKQIISNHKSTKSDIFGNLINNVSEFKNQVEEEQETYEVITGFWLFGYYYEFLNPNSEHKRILQVILPEYAEDCNLPLIEDYLNAKFYRYSSNEKFDGIIISICCPNVMDVLMNDKNVVFEIGKIAI